MWHLLGALVALLGAVALFVAFKGLYWLLVIGTGIWAVAVFVRAITDDKMP
jgi:hypothetical protein